MILFKIINMNLNQPVLDSVLSIDAQLLKLQQEVTEMDAEFAQYKPQQQQHSSPEIASDSPGSGKVSTRKVSFAQQPRIPQSSARFQNLPSVQQQHQ